MTVKKSCKYGEYGSFEHLLFLFEGTGIIQEGNLDRVREYFLETLNTLYTACTRFHIITQHKFHSLYGRPVFATKQ